VQTSVRYRKDINKSFVGLKIESRSELIEDPVDIATIINNIPPMDMNIPVDNNIPFFLVITSPIGLEYNEPRAHDIELKIKNTIPIQLDYPSSIVGKINIINPVKPAAMPAIVNLACIVLKSNNAITAIHIGIVELISAVAPDDKY
jgi:hypothetical protein